MGVDSIAPARLELKILLPPFECWDCRDELLCLTFFASTSLCLILTHISYWFCFVFSLFPCPSSLFFFFFLGDLCLILTLVVYVDTDLGITVSFSIVLTRTKEKPK